MAKIDYKLLDIDDLVSYVNNELENGRSLTRIAKEDFEVAESTIRRKLTKDNLYKRVENKFVRQCMTRSDIKEVSNGRQDDRHDVCHENIPMEIISHTTSASVTINNDAKYNGLIDNYDILMKIIEDYKTSMDHKIKFNNLAVELPQELQKDFRVTLRINDIIYKEFKEFADNNKQFTIKELVSQALKEFVEKYK